MSIDMSQINAVHEQRKRHLRDWRPIEQAAFDDRDSTDIIEQGRQDAAETFANKEKRSLRERMRFGMNKPTAIQQQQLDRGTALERTSQQTNTINNAFLQQHERNMGLKNSLYAHFNQQSIQADQAADQMYQAGVQEKQAAEAQEAQSRANTISAIGSIASTLIFA